jgi:hypothetical protein
MTYQLEEWDYEDDASINKVIEHFNKNRRLVVLIDRDKDKSFIIVGDCMDKEKDMAQGRALLAVVNSHDFPAD